MSNHERRVSPRKPYAAPLRFRVIQNGASAGDASVRFEAAPRAATTHAHFGTSEGETVNFSERGLYFVSRLNLKVGEELEMYFTLPAELTGRSSEHIRCNARVVHAESVPGKRGVTGVGVIVDRFEPITSARDWAN